MKPSKEYLDSIAQKLDMFNRINGVNPSSVYLKDDFNPMDHLGKSAMNYLNNKKIEDREIAPDPLFKDHNN